MPGPQDQLADQGRVPDQSRPHEADQPYAARVRPDDLQARLERLPANHPSSRFRDDGARKPSLPDLSEYELPLPDSPADPDLSAADQARTNPDGSWDWKGYKLSPEQCLMADQVLAKCFNAEGRDVNGAYGTRGLTPAMRQIEARLEHSRLVEHTEKFALKEPDRFKEKFANLIIERPGRDPSEPVHRLNDGVRYTFIYDDAKYSSGVMELSKTIGAAGYELYERKNSWVDSTKVYQGVNSTWRDHGNDVLFEVQVHTPASWRAKQDSHQYYAVGDSLTSTPEQRASIARHQREIFSKVPIPPDVANVPSYRKEGW